MSEVFEIYDIAMLVVGLAAFGVAGLPRVLGDRPLSFPVIYVAAGMVLFALPFGFVDPDPVEWSEATERLTEIGVIVALMGAGIRLNREIGWRSWASTWRLLGITMPLTIAAVSVLGWWWLGLTPAAAVLVGAVLAPTDPVLASDVQVGGPDEEEEDEVRFALTSEAGFNDGLAFPFTNLAILMALQGVAVSSWGIDFITIEVTYKLAVGLGGGLLFGWLLALAIFHRSSPLTQTMDGMVALAATLIAYTLTELAGGYGFIAVFIAGVMIRRQERRHEYHGVMHGFIDQIERMLSAIILILFGGAVVSGMLSPLGWAGLGTALVIIFLIRPVTGLIGLSRSPVPLKQRTAIAFFGIRGVGSFYYLAYAINHADFAQTDYLWALVGTVVLISVVIHGATATPAMRYLDRSSWRPSSPVADDPESTAPR